jgi:hypothetical protein
MKGLMQTLNAVPSQLARVDGRKFPVLIGPAPATQTDAPSQTNAPTSSPSKPTQAKAQTTQSSKAPSPFNFRTTDYSVYPKAGGTSVMDDSWMDTLSIAPGRPTSTNRAGFIVDSSAPVALRLFSLSLSLLSTLALLF